MKNPMFAFTLVAMVLMSCADGYLPQSKNMRNEGKAAPETQANVEANKDAEWEEIELSDSEIPPEMSGLSGGKFVDPYGMPATSTKLADNQSVVAFCKGGTSTSGVTKMAVSEYSPWLDVCKNHLGSPLTYYTPFGTPTFPSSPTVTPRPTFPSTPQLPSSPPPVVQPSTPCTTPAYPQPLPTTPVKYKKFIEVCSGLVSIYTPGIPLSRWPQAWAAMMYVRYSKSPDSNAAEIQNLKSCGYPHNLTRNCAIIATFKNGRWNLKDMAGLPSIYADYDSTKLRDAVDTFLEKMDAPDLQCFHPYSIPGPKPSQGPQTYPSSYGN